jgi:hypothetical protein
MNPAITVILSCWKRPQNLAEQIGTLRRQSVSPTEVWLWSDKSDQNRDFDCGALDIDRLFINSTNLGVYGRFAVALLARTKYLAIFDDDVIPGFRYLENCLETIKSHPGIIAAAGLRFLSANYRPCERYGWAKRTPVVTEVDVGCNAWFLQRDWLPYLWLEPPFDWNNGEDMRLSYLAQKYGGIRTFTPAQPDDDRCGALRSLGKDDVALSSKPGHYELRSRQLQDQLRSGWKTVRSVSL